MFTKKQIKKPKNEVHKTHVMTLRTRVKNGFPIKAKEAAQPASEAIHISPEAVRSPKAKSLFLRKRKRSDQLRNAHPMKLRNRFT
jgi:hypothetical protein